MIYLKKPPYSISSTNNEVSSPIRVAYIFVPSPLNSFQRPQFASSSLPVVIPPLKHPLLAQLRLMRGYRSYN